MRNVRRRLRHVGMVLVAVAIVVVGLPSMVQAAQPVEVDRDGVRYEILDPGNPSGAAHAIGCASGGCNADLEIAGVVEYVATPNSALEYYPVTKVINGAFKDGAFESVTLGYNIIEIGHSAFENLHLVDVKEVIIPDSVKTIGRSAFEGGNIESLVLGSNVESINTGAFNKNSIEEVHLPDSVSDLGSWVFRRNRIHTLTLPRSLEAIPILAFSGNELSNVAIPDSVHKIDSSAFDDNAITNIQWGSGLETIGENAFQRNQLQELIVPPTVTDLERRAFAANPELELVTFVGPAPQVVHADASQPIPGGSTIDQSFDTSSGQLVLKYPWRYGKEATGKSGDYTSPTWQGYDTQAIATVKFDANGHGATPPPVDIEVGKKLARPADPSARGFTFTGWYTDSGLVNKWKFSTPVTRDLTLYAGWLKDATDPDPTNPDPSGSDPTGTDPGSGDPGVSDPPTATTCHPFPDVDSSNIHCRNIEWLSGMKITLPIGGKFMPKNPVTRGSMATFLHRIAKPGQPIPACTTKPFPDVSKDYVHCGAVQWAVDNGITVGYPDGEYKPGNPVTRGSMATFLYRIAGSPATPACSSQPFGDVATNYVHCKTINWAKNNKITSGLAGGHNYGPNNTVYRDQMASFLHRIHNHTD